MHHFIRTVCAAALLATGLAANAGTVTFNGWAHGNGNTVNVNAFNVNSSTHSYSFGGAAGAFKVTLSNFLGANSRFNGSFEAYCVELMQSININGRYTDYRIVTASDYFAAKPNVAAKLTNLISYANNGNLIGGLAQTLRDDQSTALQLAIWNTVYDTDSSLALTTSTGPRLNDVSIFSTSASGSFMNATNLLANAGSATGYSLFVLQSGSQQDQLIFLRNVVPEPTSLALVALALGGAGFVSRRRKS